MIFIMKKNKLILFISLLIQGSIYGQNTLISKWGYGFGNHCAFNSDCKDIQTDLTGDHIVAGTIYTDGAGGLIDTDIDPSASVFPPAGSIHNYDFYISKYNGDGNFLSAFIIGGSGVDVCNSIAIDKNNNIIITGYYNGSVDFDPSPSSSYTLTSNGSNDIFLAKYTSSGNLIWAESFGGTSSDIGTKVIIDNQNNIFLTANFNGTLDIDPSLAISNLVSNGGSDVLLAKFNNNGNLITAISYGGIGIENSVDMVLDQNKKVLMTGTFNDVVDFNPDAVNSYTLSNTLGSADTYITKFDSVLNFEWAKSLPSSGNQAPKDINVDKYNQVLLCGFYDTQSIDLDPDPVNSHTFSSNGGGESAFIAKYDNSGNYLWAGTWGNSNLYYNIATSIWADSLGNIYSTGFFRGQVDFDILPSSTYTISNGSSGPALYYTKYDYLGNLVFAKKLTGGFIYSNTSHMDNNGDLLFAGNINSPVNIDPTGSNPYTIAMPNQCGNYFDGFIAKYSECNIPQISSVSSSTNGLCAGSTISLTVNGALNGATDWLWLQNSSSTNTIATGSVVVVNPNLATTYHVRGIGGCAGNSLGTNTISISVMPLPTATLTASQYTICPNRTNTLSITTASNNTFVWSNSSTSNSFTVMNTVDVTYSATVTGTNNCTKIFTVAVNVYSVSPLQVYEQAHLDSICMPFSTYIFAKGANTYTWTSTNGGNPLFPVWNGSEYVAQLLVSNINQAGIYIYQLNGINTNGCLASGAYSLKALDCTGIDELGTNGGSIELYPNPSFNTIKVSDNYLYHTVVRIMNTFGAEVLRIEKNERVVEINIENLAQGIYYLQLMKGSKIVATDKIIKQ